VRIRYTRRGAAELDQILFYIAKKSPQGAHRVRMRIQHLINLLSQHPHMGSLSGKSQARRLAVYPFPYLIFYQIRDDEIIIHGVRHSARDPSSMPE
jgi:plasmid stabilization system protein ParE